MLSLVAAFAVSLALAGQEVSTGTIRASSETNGSFGVVWELTIRSDNTGLVTSKSWITGKSSERRLTISAAQRRAIIQVAEDAKYGELPPRLGPPTIPLDSAMNSLEMQVGGRVHKVVLDEPRSASGPEVKRFHGVWREVVKTTPIPPPVK